MMTLSRYTDPSKVLRGIGRRLLIAGLNANRYDMSRNGEAHVVQKLSQSLELVIDVGANVGDWAAEVLKVTPKAKVFCVEAIPEFAAKIESRFGDTVTVLRTAVSNGDGEITLYKSAGGARAVPLNTSKKLERRDVSCISGDSLVEKIEADTVSFIKIDVDGYDLPVIKSFSSTIDRFLPVVQFEYSRFWIGTRHYLKDAFDFFSSRGYEVGRIMPHRIEFKDYTVSDETFMTNNFLAVPKQRLALLS